MTSRNARAAAALFRLSHRGRRQAKTSGELGLAKVCLCPDAAHVYVAFVSARITAAKLGGI
jgi:hypothetical protein